MVLIKEIGKNQDGIGILGRKMNIMLTRCLISSFVFAIVANILLLYGKMFFHIDIVVMILLIFVGLWAMWWYKKFSRLFKKQCSVKKSNKVEQQPITEEAIYFRRF